LDWNSVQPVCILKPLVDITSVYLKAMLFVPIEVFFDINHSSRTGYIMLKTFLVPIKCYNFLYSSVCCCSSP